MSTKSPRVRSNSENKRLRNTVLPAFLGAKNTAVDKPDQCTCPHVTGETKKQISKNMPLIKR